MQDTFEWDTTPRWLKQKQEAREQARITEYMNHEEKEIKELYDEAISAVNKLEPDGNQIRQCEIITAALINMKYIALKAIRRTQK